MFNAILKNISRPLCVFNG